MKEFENPTIEVVNLTSLDLMNASYELPFLPFNLPDTFDIVNL